MESRNHFKNGAFLKGQMIRTKKLHKWKNWHLFPAHCHFHWPVLVFYLKWTIGIRQICWWLWESESFPCCSAQVFLNTCIAGKNGWWCDYFHRTMRRAGMPGDLFKLTGSLLHIYCIGITPVCFPLNLYNPLYSTSMSYLSKRPATPSNENFAFLILFISGSIE